jgi:hypothetical protein
MKKFMRERGFLGPLHETSAKSGAGCDRLRDAIVGAIDWKNLLVTTSPTLYHRMKQENATAIHRLSEFLFKPYTYSDHYNCRAAGHNYAGGRHGYTGSEIRGAYLFQLPGSSTLDCRPRLPADSRPTAARHMEPT